MSEEKKSSPVLILAAWLVVLIPAAWGVYNVGKQASKLFSASPSPQAAQPVNPQASH